MDLSKRAVGAIQRLFVSVYPADVIALNVIEYEQWNVAHFYDFSSRPACNFQKLVYSICSYRERELKAKPASKAKELHYDGRRGDYGD